MKKINTIYIELTKTIIIAACLAFCLYEILNFLGNQATDYYIKSMDYAVWKEEKISKKFREYVQNQRIDTNDISKIEKWVNRYPITMMQIYKDGELIYDKSSIKNEEEASSKNNSRLWEKMYLVNFQDGEAEVFLIGNYTYLLYVEMQILYISVSLLSFFVILWLIVRRRIQYILKLCREVQVLEQGNLELPVTINGKDELATLASGIETMRCSLKKKAEKEKELLDENERIVREMSHDLRTPLTSLFLYTGILKESGCADREIVLEYLDKIERKLHQMKQLSEHIFEFSMIESGRELKCLETQMFKAVFYDHISEISAYLTQKGYNIEVDADWDNFNEKIKIEQDYLNRTFDNLISNIEKYADEEGIIKIEIKEINSMYHLIIKNKIKKDTKNLQSSKIGLESVKRMMTQMNGSSIFEIKEDCFEIKLIFPIVKS